MNKSTKYGTMKRLEKIAEMLGVNLDEVEPLPSLEIPVITLESLEAEEAAAAAAEEEEVS